MVKIFLFICVAVLLKAEESIQVHSLKFSSSNSINQRRPIICDRLHGHRFDSQGTTKLFDPQNRLIPTLLNYSDKLPTKENQNEKIDAILQHLVSPAPESFYVIEQSIKRLQDDTISDKDFSHMLLNLESLSRFLLKRGFSLELCKDEEGWTWEVVPQGNHTKTIVCTRGVGEIQVKKSSSQVYHNLTALELARSAINLVTNERNKKISMDTNVYDIGKQVEKRLALTLGSDLRGRSSADAAFHLALAGIQESSHIFDALAKIGIHELKRAGMRSSFKSKYILQMVEKFAACGIRESPSVSKLYITASICLEKKGYSDTTLINNLKSGDFGLHSDRPLLWLWRFSARQKKATLRDFTTLQPDFAWDNYLYDPAKELVVDIGCGCGVSLLNLSLSDGNTTGQSDDLSTMKWSELNFVGADLNSQMISYANGVVSRNQGSRGRAHFFHLPAMELLTNLQSYPGKIELILIQFPSPYRFPTRGIRSGNSQLPSSSSDGYMISRSVAELVSILLDKSGGSLMFQTKCEDIAIHTKNLFLEAGMQFQPCKSPVTDIDKVYIESQGKRPKRVEEWLKIFPDIERAEGIFWSSQSFMPIFGRTETEVNADHDRVVVHRCLFSSKGILRR